MTITHPQHDNNLDTCGTHLQGEIDCSYATLKKLFGKPCSGYEYEVDAEWCLKFPCGTVATIYNYKDGKNYCGRSGIATTKLRNWHIGGYDDKAVLLVKIAVLEAGQK